MGKCYAHEECEYNGQPECRLPDGMECPHGAKAYKPTNADRIRDMSDEELAKWLEYEGGGACAEVCGWLEWLQQPAEEDH